MENNKDAQKKFEELGIEEVIKKDVKKFGTSWAVYLPKKYIGRNVTVIIMKDNIKK